MIDISKIRYGLIVPLQDGRSIHLDKAQRGVSLSEQKGELAESLRVEFTNQKIGDSWLHQLMPLGNPIFYYANWGTGWNRIFEGKIFKALRTEDPVPRLSITAYDPLYYLQKSEDNRYYPAGTTGRAIITDIFNEWGISIGTIDGPDIPLGKNPFRANALSDMIMQALKQSKNKGSGTFFPRYQDGKAHVLRPGQNTPIYHFGPEAGVGQIEEQDDIEDLVTRVKIYGASNDDGRPPVEAVLDGLTEFGTLQKIVTKSQNDDQGAANEEANQILKDQGKINSLKRVNAPDLPFLRKGDKVHIHAGTLNGYYIIEGIEHDPDTRRMTMEVDTENEG